MNPGLVIHLMLALFVGWGTQRLMGYREIDFLTTLAIGLLGSYLGNAIARWLSLPYAYPGDIIQTWGNISIPYAIAGCAMLIVIVNLFFRGTAYETDE